MKEKRGKIEVTHRKKASFWASPLLCILLFCFPHSVLFFSPSFNLPFYPLCPPLSLSLTIKASSSSTCLCWYFPALASLFCFQGLQLSLDPHESFYCMVRNSWIRKPTWSLFTILPFFSSLFSSLHKSHPLFNQSGLRFLLK